MQSGESRLSEGKPGLASLMRRAVKQAKAEAAAQAAAAAAAAAGQSPAEMGHLTDAEGQSKGPSNGKKALSAMLKRAAKKMQEQEALAVSQSMQAATPPDASMHGDQPSPQTAPDQQQLQHEHQDTDQSLWPVHDSQQPLDAVESALDAAHVRLHAPSQDSNPDSITKLLPSSLSDSWRPPRRHQSLGERLSSLLKALSLPKQPAYMAVDGDQDSDMDESSEQPPPSSRRVLPRDASYLPEWLNQTLKLSPHASGDPFTASGDAVPAYGDAHEPLRSEEDTALPQWVDWSALKPEEEEEKVNAAPVRGRHAPLAVFVQDTPQEPEALHAEDTVVPATTPKGQSLFEFWQQKSAAGTPATSESLKPTSVHARRYLSTEDTGSPLEPSPLATSESAATLPEGSEAHPHETLARAHWQGTSAEAQTLAEAQTGTGLAAVQAGSASAALVAELEAASQLVHKQSLQQAELLEGLERALSQLSEHRLLIQNPQARLQALAEDRWQGTALTQCATHFHTRSGFSSPIDTKLDLTLCMQWSLYCILTLANQLQCIFSFKPATAVYADFHTMQARQAIADG